MPREGRTLPHTIDHLASKDGSRVWASYPETGTGLQQGQLREVTFAALANAINRLAWHLKERLPDSRNGDVLCYIGPSDIRYFILMCAACKAGLSVLFSSPRNNVEAHLSLLDKTSCRTLLGPAEKGEDELSRSLVASRDLWYETVPALADLLHQDPVEPYPWTAGFDDVKHDPLVILHTSGSTGLPKPVGKSHGLIATIDAQQDLRDVDGRSVSARRWADRCVYTALPPFHSAGLNFFSFSIFQGTRLILGPPDQPPSVSIVEHMLDLRVADAAVMAPSLLAEAAQDPAVLEKMSQWSSVTFGGGPLPQEAGDALWQRTQVLQILGSTETFNVPELEPRSVDEWAYHHFHPSLNIEFRPHSDNLFELMFHRDPQAIQHQGAFWTFPDQQEYSMKDLYESHPTKPNCWKYRGRLDDIIVLSNGEKFNPTDAEHVISRHAAVKSALVVGSEKEQPAVLVEPAPRWKDESADREVAVGEAVAQANATLPAHAQIHASHVRVLDAADSFLRSSKGEIRRAPTVDHLSDVIEQIYQSADQESAPASTLDFSTEQALTDSLTALLSAEYLGGKPVGDADNLFECGLDSLRVVKLLRNIKASLRDQQRDPGFDLTPRMIYQNPTAREIAAVVSKSLEGEHGHIDAVTHEDDMLKEMQRILEDFSSRIDGLHSQQSAKAVSDRQVVLLTGSTGSLGSYILHTLIRDPAVNEVICLNRPGSDARKQAQSNQSRSLSTDFQRVRFLESDPTKPSLGVSSEAYDDLSRKVTHIVHNAWNVNFNLPLSSFDAQLEGCWSLIELAHASPNNVSTAFLSSIGAANHWLQYGEGAVPERLLTDLRVAETMGYAQSKQLAELIFAHASQRLGMRVSICRLGQIAGPVQSAKGAWNAHEWFPSVMLSCQALGSIPASMGAMDRMDWIPVDLLGEMIVDSVLASPMLANKDVADQELECLHFVNPRDAYWSDIAPSLVGRSGGKVRLVEYDEWLKDVTNAAEHEDAADEVPAARLLPFFHAVGEHGAQRPAFATEETQERCSRLRSLEPVPLEWLQHWIRQWQLDELLPAREGAKPSVESYSRL